MSVHVEVCLLMCARSRGVRGAAHTDCEEGRGEVGVLFWTLLCLRVVESCKRGAYSKGGCSVSIQQ